MRDKPRAETWTQHPVTAWLEIRRLQDAGERAAAELIYKEIIAFSDHDMSREVRGRMRWERALNLVALGRFAEAEQPYIEACRYFDGEPDSPEMWHLRINLRAELALALCRLGRYEDAEVVLSAAIAALDASGGGHQNLFRCGLQMNRAITRYELGRYEDAEALYGQLYTDLASFPTHPHVMRMLATVTMNRASNFKALDRFQEAIDANLEAQQLYDSFPRDAEVDASRATVRANRATLLSMIDERSQAEALFAEAAPMLDQLSETLRLDTERITVHLNRAINLVGLERYEEAEAAFTLAATLLDAAPDVEPVRRDRFRLCSKRGEGLHKLTRYTEAETYLRCAQQLADALPDSGRTREWRLQVRLTRAANLDALNQPMLAAQLFRQAEVIFSSLPPEPRARLGEPLKRWHEAHGAVLEPRVTVPSAIVEERLDAEVSSVQEIEPSPRQMTPQAPPSTESSAEHIERGQSAFAQSTRADELHAMGYYAEAEALYQQAQSGLDALPEVRGIDEFQADARIRRATNLTALGELKRARALFADAHRIYQGMPDDRIVRLNRSMMLFNQALSAAAAGELTQAETLLMQARQGLDTVEDCEERRVAHLRILEAHASVLSQSGQRVAAEALYAEAQQALMTLAEVAQVQAHHCLIRVNRANNLRELGCLEQALTLLAEANTALDRMEETSQTATYRRGVMKSQAAILSVLGRGDEAESIYANLHEAINRLPASHASALEQATNALNRAGNACQSGHNAAAERIFEQAQSILEALIGEPGVFEDYVKLVNNRATNLRMLGRHRDAEALYGRLDSLPPPNESSSHWPAMLLNRAENLQELKHTEEALAWATRAMTLADRAEDSVAMRLLRSHVRRAMASCVGDLGQWDAAQALYAEAQLLCADLADNAAVISERAELHQALATAWARRGQLQHAIPRFEAAQRALHQLPRNPLTAHMAARFGNNFATALQELGRCAEAEKIYADTQAYEDRAPPSPDTQQRRVTVRVNRAGNLSQMGHTQPALKLFEDAQKICDALPESSEAESSEIQALRVSVRTARAALLSDVLELSQASELLKEARTILNASSGLPFDFPAYALLNWQHGALLARMGDALAAEALLSEAQRGYESAHPNPRIDSELGRVQLDRARNLCELGRPEEALSVLECAQSLFDAQPDTTVTRYQRATVRVRQCALHGSVSTARAWGQWQEARGMLTTLRDASVAYYGRLAPRLGACLFQIQRTGFLSSDECRREADSLAAWVLDWADLADIGEVAEHAAAGLQAFFGEYLSWLVSVGDLEHIPEVLSLMFGRHAAAEQAAQRINRDADSQSVRDLTLAIRGLNSQIGRLEADPSLLHRLPQLDAQIEQLYTRRDAACAELRAHPAAQSHFESVDARLAPLLYSRITAALQARARAALVILFRVHDASDRPESPPTAARSRALAMVIRSQAIRPSIISLPKETMVAAMPCATPSEHSGYRGRFQRGSAALGAGRTLRAAVEESWRHILPALVEVDDIYIAMHHELGHLPWSAGLPIEHAARVRMHYGVTLAVQALEQATTMLPIAPPQPHEPIVLLAHSPADTLEETHSFGPIPAVYGDLAVTARHWPHAHQVVNDTDALLATPARLAQISSHGNQFSLHTGPGSRHLTAFELAYALDQTIARGEAPMRVLITVACSTTQAGTNALGESGGWPVMLHGRVRVVLGALYPVDDLFCMLWVLLLHRQWRRCGDLHAALARTREQMRSGAWADSDTEGEALVCAWAEGLEIAAARARSEGVVSQHIVFAGEAQALAAHYYRMRHRLYDDEPRYQSVTEAFVVFG